MDHSVQPPGPNSAATMANPAVDVLVDQFNIVLNEQLAKNENRQGYYGYANSAWDVPASVVK